MPDEPVLTSTPEGATVRYRGRYLYSPETPRSSAVRRAEGATVRDRTLCFVPSLGLGYGLDALLDRCPPSSHILCVEIDQVLMALGSRGSLPRDSRLSIVRTGDPRVVAAVLARLGLDRFRRCLLVNLCGGYLLYRTDYDAMFRAIETAIAEHWQNRLTSIHLGALWVKNLIENLPLLVGAVPIERFRARGPVVVVGAGPSVDGMVGLLRDLRGRARLVAVDTALPILAGHGLEPDLVFILEAQHANLYDFLPLPRPSLPVVADLTAHPASLRLFSGARAFVLSSFGEPALFSRMESRLIMPRRIPALGSVGVAACAAALELTDEEVLTCGLDFAYDRDKTHAAGAPLHAHALIRARRLDPALSFFYAAIRRRPLIGQGPGRPMTDAVLRSYANSLSVLAAQTGRIRRLEPDGSTTPWADASLTESLGALPAVDRAALPPSRPAPTMPAVVSFLEEELVLLRDAAEVTRRLLRERPAAAPAPGDAAAIRAVDYAALHFPEAASGEAGPEISLAYLARLRHALAVYEIRIRRLADRCLAAAPTALRT